MSDELAGHNPYQPPVARVDDALEVVEERFQVVAPWKFLLLMIGTLGLYALYWFYRNWTLLNRRHKQYWPVPRAIFSIFFTHSLFEEIDASVRKRGQAYAWSHSLWATTYVISVIASSICDRLAFREIGSPLTDVVSLLLWIPMFSALYVAQRAINVAEGDPEGDRNARITALNVMWLVFGALGWILVLFGLYLILVEGVEA